MRKSTVIATCFANSMRTTVEHGELVVRNYYDDKPRPLSFGEWNTEVPNDIAAQLIRHRSNAMRFDVDQFIDDLS